MAGRIRDEDVALVRERTSIVDVVSEYVTLKPAGGGNVKGLCPFHDEKTPSFNVASAKGVYFCYGCGAGGDAITFVMTLEHLSFVEAVERLAARAGVQLRYVEAGPAPVRPQAGQRQRLTAANAAAAGVLRRPARLGRRARPPASSSLSGASTGRPPRRTAAASPRKAGILLTKHLRQKGFSSQELVTAGLSKEARSGNLIDRFRRRLLWPIRDLSGDVIGFGARKLFDDDEGPKYLNTPETPLYKKSHVLYGIDHAKREIAKQGRAVIVEGYTDVMACHLAGVPTAVATCGTAFGADHIGVLRRLLMDNDVFGGEIIFTFDGDAAGQKAALRAFEEDQRFVAADLHRGQPGQHGPVRAPAGQGRCGRTGSGRPARADDLVRAALAPVQVRPGPGRGAGRGAEGDCAARGEDQGSRLGQPIRPQARRRPRHGRGGGGPDGRHRRPALDRGARSGPAAHGRTRPKTRAPWSSGRRSSLPCRSRCWPVRCSTPLTRPCTPTRCTWPSAQAIAGAGGAAAAAGGAGWIEAVRERDR